MATVGHGSRRLGSTAYRNLRATARHMGLGRARARVQASIQASPLWVTVPPRRLKDISPAGHSSANTFALTYDDGPDPDVTPKLLDLLEVRGAKATFFMCGLAAQRHPELVRAVVEAGHTIGGHSWDHRLVRKLSDSEWRRQVDDTHALLADLSGRQVRWFRPPRGMTDRGTWERLRTGGVTTVLWSAAGRDWTLGGPALIADSALGELGPGGIVLLHDSIADFGFSARDPSHEVGNQEPTVRATEIIIRTAGDRGMRPIALDALRDCPMPGKSRIRLQPARGRSDRR